jgi:hypothetical protein
MPSTTRAVSGVGCANAPTDRRPQLALKLRRPRVDLVGADCVGFLLFVVLALIVPGQSHRSG